MSVEATTAAWARRDVTSTEKLVLVRIADHAGPDGGDAWPSVARLMRDTGLSERAVQCAVRSLETKGALSRQIGKGPHGTNRYRISLTPSAPPHHAPPAVAAPPQDVHPPPAGRAPRGGQVVHPNRPLNHQEPPRGQDATVRFDAFWQLYPPRHGKRENKAKALEQWKRMKPSERDQAAVAVVHYRAAVVDGLTIAADAFRWLRDRRWPDWMEPATIDGATDDLDLMDRSVPFSELVK